jgi:uncharacterized protein YjbJ (UPF0337 family)
MSMDDKIQNKTEEFGGKAKEGVGNLTGDEKLAQQGRNDQAKAGVKEAVNDVKDAVRDATNKVKDALHKN